MSALGCGGVRLQWQLQDFKALILASQEAARYKRILESLAALSAAISEELLCAIRISLRGLSGDVIKMMHVQPEMTIAELRQSIRELLALGPQVRLSLILGNSELQEHADGLSLAACGIEDGTILHMLKKPILTVLTASTDGNARIWSASTGECLQILSGHELAVLSAVMSVDAASVLTASDDATARIWSAFTGECQQILSGHEDTVYSAVFSADEASVLTASSDFTARIWSASTGKCQQILSGHEHAVDSAVFSADAASVLTASRDRTARIWSASTGECQQILSGHEAYVESAVFSADAASVLTASSDWTASIWSASTGVCQQILSGHENVCCLQCSQQMQHQC